MARNVNITWRQQNVEIPANSVKDVFFLDTHPNAFYIANNNDTEIYISLTYTPTVDKYEVELKRNDRDTFGRPTPTNRMYILNPSSKQISVTVFSAEDMFDMALLKNFKVDIANSALQAIAFDGIIKGVKGGLNLPVRIMNPNDIQVTIPSDLTINATFPDGTKLDLGGDAISIIRAISETVAALKNGQSSNHTAVVNEIKKVVTAVTNGGGIATTAKGGTQTSAGEVVFNFTEIDMLVNDASADLTVMITTAGGNTSVVLKKDETLSDVKLKGSKLTFSSSGAVNARYLLLG